MAWQATTTTMTTKTLWHTMMRWSIHAMETSGVIQFRRKSNDINSTTTTAIAAATATTTKMPAFVKLESRDWQVARLHKCWFYVSDKICFSSSFVFEQLWLIGTHPLFSEFTTENNKNNWLEFIGILKNFQPFIIQLNSLVYACVSVCTCMVCLWGWGM